MQPTWGVINESHFQQGRILHRSGANQPGAVPGHVTCPSPKAAY